MKFDSIIFDLDGTLWNSSETVAESWNAVLEHEKHPLRITGSDVLKHMGKSMDVIMRDVFGADMKDKEVSDFLEKLSVEEIRLIREKGGVLFPKLEETLSLLKENYRLFIVSNCQNGYIEAFLEAHKLSSYFEGFMCWGDTKLPKGETNKQLIEKYSLKNAVYIGDTEGDHISAVTAGIPFVHASYGFGEVSGYDYKIDEINELPVILSGTGE